MKKESHIHLGNLIIIVGTFLAAVLLVTMTEGRIHYWHLFLIPLLIAGVTYNLGGSLATWFLLTGFIVWSMLYNNYPENNIELWMDGVFGLAIAVGLGIYAKRTKQTSYLLEKMSERDGLTGLENYSHFTQRLSEEKNRSDRYKTPFSLILMDIDHFKTINDSYGHEAGNKVLKQFSEIIRSQTREVDLGARYGGDEFAVVLTNADSESALKFANRICDAIDKLRFDFAGSRQTVTVSAGVATYPQNASTESELVVCADQSLYQAKSEGKNRVCVCSASLKHFTPLPI